MGALEGQLEFVDSLKPDITSYLATETVCPSAQLGNLNLANWLTSKRLLCYFRPSDEEELWQNAKDGFLEKAPDDGSSETPLERWRSIFGAPPSPRSLRWPGRPTSADVDRALGRADPQAQVPPVPNEDSGSDSGKSDVKDSKCRRRREDTKPQKIQKEVGPSLVPRNLGDELLEFTSCFESGNLRCVLYDKEVDEYLLFLDNDINSRGHTQWFYFAVRNGRAGRVYRIRIVNMSKPKTLFRVGMRPVAWSELDAQRRLCGSKKSFEESVWDGAVGLWKPVGEDVRYYRTAGSVDGNTSTLSFDYVFERGHDSVFFAYYVPYTYSMLRWTLNHLVRDPTTRAFCRVKPLAMTLGEARCDMLTITNSRIERKMKKAVIVSARVHPGESNASWLVHGLIGFLLSSTAEAQVLRDNFVWICVPMLNPDGVICGNYRCGLCGTDLNRQWKQPHKVLHASVHKLKKLVARSKAKLSMYLDLHGHSRKCGIFAYACGQFGEEDHRRFTVRIYPKLLSMLTPEFNFFHCRWSVGKGKRGTGRVVAAKDLGITNAYTIEASMWGAVDVMPASKAGDSQEEDALPVVVAFTTTKLQVFGANLARALIVQHSLGPMVQGRLRCSRAWDGGKGGPWPTLTSEKELAKEVASLLTSSASPCESADSTSESEDMMDSDTERPDGLPPQLGEFAEDTYDYLETQQRFEEDSAFLHCNVSDIMDDLVFPDADSESGGSDSDPSVDNLEDSKLRQIEEKLIARRKPSARSSSKRKARGKSTTNTAPTTPSKRLIKAPSRKEIPPVGARQRAKSFGRKEKEVEENSAKAEKLDKEPARPRDVVVPRPPLEKVVAFGGTTYLMSRQRGGSCMPRLQEKEVKNDPLEATVSKDRLERLSRRGLATAVCNLTANPRVQLAAARVLGRAETQECFSPKSPQNRSRQSLHSFHDTSPTSPREERDEAPFHSFLHRFDDELRENASTIDGRNGRIGRNGRKSRPKTASLCRNEGNEKVLVQGKAAAAPRSESEHGRRCSDSRNPKDPDGTPLSPCRTLRSSGARPFNFKPPEIVAGTGDKIAIAALRSWATAATTLAKANFDEDRVRDDRNGYEKGCEDRNSHEFEDRRNHGSGSIGSTGSMGSIASIGSQGRPRECAEAEAS